MRKYMKFVFALLLCGSVVYGAGRWTLTAGNLNVARSGATSSSLSDGRVMTFGGMSSNAKISYEVFDPSTGRWQAAALPVADSTMGGIDHTNAMLLPSGDVLVESNKGYLWLYKPDTKTWENTWQHWQTSFAGSLQECWNLMYDGRVLFVDHPGGPPCYIYEWNVDTLRRIANNIDGSSGLYDRFYSAEVRLPDGKVMMVGGWRLDQQVYSSCEVFDPISETFSYTGSLLTGLVKHVAVLLRTTPQKVLTAGGNTTTSQIFDVATQTWSYSGATQNVSPRVIADLTLLPNGKALLMGGSGLNSCELYNPLTDQWTNADPMTIERWHFVTTILPTGKVLAHGEYNTGGDVRTEIYDPAENAGWTTQMALNVARSAATTTLLPIKHTANCSTNILIVGGENSGGTALASCELFNYKDNTTALTGTLGTPRTHHTANLTPDPDGKVFVTGGKNGATALSSCEMYSLSGGTWAPTASMGTPRFDHTSTLLKDGTILVTGGENTAYTNTCEIFNGTAWTATTGTMATARARHTAVLLLDGRVMVIGGETSAGNPTNACEIYDPSTGVWTSAGSAVTARSWHSAVLLQSGKVLVIGGKNASGTALSSCEIYDPTLATWSTGGTLNTARYLHSAAMTYAGLVIVSGGNGDLASCELYDPATNAWSNTGTFGPGRSCHSTVLVPYTKPFVYAIGGTSGSTALSSIDRFDFGLGYESNWQSTINSHYSIIPISSTMNIKGSLFRDITEADGGNHCHTASTDHPIISLVRIGGGNFQSNGGGDIITMPLSSYWDTANTTVHPKVSDFAGYYRLWSIVNGIPCKWWAECAGVEENTDKTLNEDTDIKVFPIPATTSGINFQLTKKTLNPVNLYIYDLSGSLVKSILFATPGTVNTICWNGRNNDGKKVQTGIYFYSVNGEGFAHKGKFIIVK
ncbi:MAG: kelch repeat-containing protein [bacterium]